MIFVPILCNAVANALENPAAKMPPLRDNFSIEIIYKLSILDNISNLYIFYDDQQILYFIDNFDVFKDTTIYKEVHAKALQVATNASKVKLIPKDVVSLQKLYDLQNRF